jgi:GR25 family glycosyltransferase involved in LPS biosynthesis
MADWTGAYINLDRSTDRRAAIEAQLARADLDYGRFPAVDGGAQLGGSRLLPGQLGCWLSHQRLVSELGGTSWLHVIEDDAILSTATKPLLVQMIDSGQIDAFDLVFLDIAFAPDMSLIGMLSQLFSGYERDGSYSLLDLRRIHFSGTDSYLVNPRSAAKVKTALQAPPQSVPQVPLDVHLRGEVRAGRLSAAAIFPFVTTVDLATPSIISLVPSGNVLNVLRRSFFVERDLKALQSTMAGLLSEVGIAEAPHSRLVGDALRYVASDRFPR